MADYDFKLRWAYYHLTELQTQASNWFNEDNHRIWADPDADHPGYFLIKASADRPSAHPFGLLAGDCIQNLRSSLDHLAFALAVAHANAQGVPLTKDIEKSSQFPIYGNIDRKGRPVNGAATFNGQIMQSIGGIDPVAQAIIKDLQPYQRGNLYDTDPLWILSELSNIDKHRLIHPATAFFGGIQMFPGQEFTLGDVGFLQSFEGVLEGETVVGRVEIPGQRNEMDMELYCPLGIAFDKSSPVAPGEQIDGRLSHAPSLGRWALLAGLPLHAYGRGQH